MNEERFIVFPNNVVWDNQLGEVVCRCILEGIGDAENVCQRLNELHEENMGLRAKHTQMVIIMKDVVKDLKRIDTYRYAEHLEKIANLRFLSEKELEDE